jgi:hypothetical protein
LASISVALHFLVEALEAIGGLQLYLVPGREFHVDQNIILSFIHRLSELWMGASGLIPSRALGSVSFLIGGRREGLAQQSR